MPLLSGENQRPTIFSRCEKSVYVSCTRYFSSLTMSNMVGLNEEMRYLKSPTLHLGLHFRSPFSPFSLYSPSSSLVLVAALPLLLFNVPFRALNFFLVQNVEDWSQQFVHALYIPCGTVFLCVQKQ